MLSAGSEELISIFFRELTRMVSALLLEAQNATYGMQRLLLQKGVDETLFWEATEEINQRYFSLLLGREDYMELEL